MGSDDFDMTDQQWHISQTDPGDTSGGIRMAPTTPYAIRPPYPLVGIASLEEGIPGSCLGPCGSASPGWYTRCAAQRFVRPVCFRAEKKSGSLGAHPLSSEAARIVTKHFGSL